jgi:peptidoglycan biosynthesis protein MviN/MurJ (putative lipid II flippase)
VPGFGPEKQTLTVSLVRVMLVGPVIFGISGLVMGILNAQHQFLLPGLAPSAYTIGIILGAWLLIPIGPGRAGQSPGVAALVRPVAGTRPMWDARRCRCGIGVRQVLG